MHNDLKSFNILVTKGGDFGFVAKLADLECVPGPCRSAAPHPALARSLDVPIKLDPSMYTLKYSLFPI